MSNNLPTFNGFSLQDENFITERVTMRGYGERGVIRAKVNRREGIKLLATEFGEKEITVEGNVIADSAEDLQEKLDDLKSALTAEEGNLVVEAGRTFKATVEEIEIPDEHYNQSKAPYEITFVCTNPFAEGDLLTVGQNVPSGVFTFSGLINISGTMYVRPTIIYTPGSPTAGQTLIRKLDIYHLQTGQTVTISGFNNGTNLRYQDPITVIMEDYTTFEGSNPINNSGAFMRFEPGTNLFTITSSGRFPGGHISFSYKPRYL